MRGPRVGRFVETGSIAGSLSVILGLTGLFLSPTATDAMGIRVSAGAGNTLYVTHMACAVLLVAFVVWHLAPPTYSFVRKAGQRWTSYLLSLSLLSLVLVETVTGYILYAHDYRLLDKAVAVRIHLWTTAILFGLLAPHAWRGITLGVAWSRAQRQSIEGSVAAGRPEDARARQETITRRMFVRVTTYAALGFALAWAFGRAAAHEVRAWRLNSIGPTPALTKENWRLKITGLVNTPVEIDFRDLLELNDVTETFTHYCVEGWTYRDSFTGVRLSDVLEKAGGVRTGANMIVFKSAERYRYNVSERYTTNFPYTDSAVRDALVVYAVGGADLPPEHGFPVRLMTPKKWGYKACKWLVEIELIADPTYQGFWERRGYHNVGDHPGPIFA